MVKKSVYVAFDYDDLGVKQNLIKESQSPECPWNFVDNSMSVAFPDQWVAEARRLITMSERIIVLCGEQTHQAKGVETELQIAQELGKPYFLLSCTREGTPTMPTNARAEEQDLDLQVANGAYAFERLDSTAGRSSAMKLPLRKQIASMTWCSERNIFILVQPR